MTAFDFLKLTPSRPRTYQSPPYYYNFKLQNMREKKKKKKKKKNSSGHFQLTLRNIQVSDMRFLLFSPLCSSVLKPNLKKVLKKKRNEKKKKKEEEEEKERTLINNTRQEIQYIFDKMIFNYKTRQLKTTETCKLLILIETAAWLNWRKKMIT